MAEEFKVRIGAELDSSSFDNIRNQLNTLQNNTHRVRIDLDTTRVQRQINSIRRQIENLGRIRINLNGDFGSGGRSGGLGGIQRTVTQTQEAYNDLMNLARKINSIRLQIGGLDSSKSSSQITELSGQLNSLMTTYNNLYNTFTRGLDLNQLTALENRINSVNANLERLRASEQTASRQGIDTSTTRANIQALEVELSELIATYHRFSNGLSMGQIDNLTNTFQNTTDKISVLNAKISDTKRNLADGIIVKLNTNKFNSDIASLENKFNKLEGENEEISAGMNKVRKAFEEMNIAARTNNVDALISANERYEASLKDVSNQISINLKRQQEANNAQNLLNNKNNLSLQMDVWLKNNSAAASQFGAKIRSLQAELKSCDSVRFTGIKSEFQQITKQAALAGKATQSFKDKFKKEFSKLSAYFSASAAIMQTIRALRSMYSNVVKIDTAMTELKKVTDETDNSYSNFLKNAANSAKEIGTTIDGLVSSTADFARLGYGFNESQELAKVANIYAVVGDEISDVEEATEHLISTTAAYGKEVDAMSIIDKFNEIGNNFAISSGGIGEALERSASSMKAAGNSLDETIALVTAANTVVQDPASVGTAWKTISMRIRGAETELEEAGLDTEGMVKSTAKLRKEIMALSGVDIMINEDEFKSTYQIMDELAKKWGELTDIQQASITELIAGKRQGNIVSSLMQNFDIAREALEVSGDSAGSAITEHAKWMESLEAKIQQLKASWQSLSQSFLTSDFLKGLIENLTSFIDLLDNVVNKFGTLPTLLATISGGMALSGRGLLKFDVNNGTFSLLNKNVIGLKDNYTQLQTAIGRYNSLSTKSASFQTAYNNALAKSNSSIGKYLSGLNGATASIGGYAKHLVVAKAKTIGLQVATTALNVALTMGLSIAIQAIATKLSDLVHAQKNASESAHELAQESKEEAKSQRERVDSINELIAKYKELANSDTQDTDTRNQIKEIQNEIVNLVGNQAGNIDLVNGKLDTELEKLKKISLEQAKISKDKNQSAYHNAKKDNENAIASDSFLFFDGYVYADKREKEVEDILRKNGYKNSVSFGGVFGNNKTFVYDEYDEELNKLETATEKAEYLQGMVDVIRANYADYASSDLYNALLSQIDTYNQLTNEQVSSAQNLLNSVTYLESYDSELNGIIVNSAHSFEEYKNKLTELVKNSPDLSEAIKAGDISEDDISTHIEEYMSTLSGFSDYYNDWCEEFKPEKLSNKLKEGLDFEGSDDFIKSLSNKEIEVTYGIYESQDTSAWSLEDWEKAIGRIGETASSVADNLNISIPNMFGVESIPTDAAKEAYQDYKNIIDEANELKVDTSQTVFGNIDTNNRQVLEWTKEELDKYREELKSWGYSNNEIKDLEGTISTVLGGFNKFDGVDIAFSPMLQTENGAVLLSDDTVNKYITQLINKATENDGSWTNEELFKLDTQGLEVDGQIVKNILADIGNTAEKTSQSMHFTGTDGAISNAIEELKRVSGVANDEFDNLFNSLEFEDSVDTYIEKVTELKDALYDYQSGNFSNDDLNQLLKDFPELANQTDNLDVAIVSLLGDLNNDMLGEFSNQFGNLDTNEDVQNLSNFQEAVLQLGSTVGSTEMSIDIEAESEGMNNLFTAMKESVTSTGLTSESISNLKERYQELEDYDAARLFERTENGIHLNTKALRELEAEYEKQKKNDSDTKLQSLENEYNSLTEQINNCSDANKKAELYAQRSDILEQIEDTSMLAAQYEGLTSAFYKWEQAQSIGEEGDMYDSLTGGLEHIKELYEDGLIGTNEFRTAVQLMSNEDLSTANIDELISAYESGYSKMERYFTDSSDGCLNFLSDVQELNSEWVHMNEDGSWDINFGVGNDQEIADELGINVESIQAIMRKLSDYGFDINLDSVYSKFELLQTEAEKVNEKLKELGATEYTFNVNTANLEDAKTQIEEAKNALSNLKDKDGNLKVGVSEDDYNNTLSLLSTLIYRKNELEAPVLMSVEVDPESTNEVEQAIGLLQEYKNAVANYEYQASIGADTTEAQKNIQNVVSKINDIPDDVKTKLNLDDEEFRNAINNIKDTEVNVKAKANISEDSLNAINTKLSGITADIIVKAGVDATKVAEYDPEEKNSKVNYEVNDSKVVKFKNQNHDVSANVNYTAKFGKVTAPSIEGTYYYKFQKAGVDGTAHSKGTAFVNGNAFAKGNWGTKESGIALGGELGQELVRFYSQIFYLIAGNS